MDKTTLIIIIIVKSGLFLNFLFKFSILVEYQQPILLNMI
jgi:hypothetical protein